MHPTSQPPPSVGSVPVPLHVVSSSSNSNHNNNQGIASSSSGGGHHPPNPTITTNSVANNASSSGSSIGSMAAAASIASTLSSLITQSTLNTAASSATTQQPTLATPQQPQPQPQQQQPPQQPPQQQTAILFPPDAYGCVQGQIHRSNTPDPHNISFIRSLGLRSVLLLGQETPTRALLSFLEESNIKLNHLGLRCWKPSHSWRPISEELVKDGLEFVLSVANHPVLIMCTGGIHDTGTFVGCLRKLQGWNFNSIIVEYQFYAGSKARSVNEQFIELFDLDLITLPKDLPSWFIDAQRMLEEDERELIASMALSSSSSIDSLVDVDASREPGESKRGSDKVKL